MDISQKQATEIAKNEAIKKAIEKICGTGNVSIWTNMEGKAAGECFNSLTLIQNNGEVVDIEEIDHNVKKGEIKGNLIYWWEGNISVKKGVEPDPDFKANVKNLQPFYEAGEELTFTVKPYGDAYLKIFIFENEETGYLLYPNGLEKPFTLTKNTEYTFPTNKRAYYPLFTDKEEETDWLVFVFTKTECPFEKEDTQSRREIEKWIAKLRNDQKFIHYACFKIMKERK